MSKLDDALKRFEQVATFGMRESDYIKVDDSLAWFREDLAVVKTALSKKDELLGLYQTIYHELLDENDFRCVKQKIETLKKELGEMK